MSRRPLTAQEKAAWERVKATVKPLDPHRAQPVEPVEIPAPAPAAEKPTRARRPLPAKPVPAAPASASPPADAGLDSHWDRRFKRGSVMPDVRLDLHGLNLSGAYQRLDGALEQAILTGARTVLLVTGQDRGHDRASGKGRGAIRAAVHDWLSASRHASHIASVRNAHPRHGGAGALYIVLKRGR